jgi:hypothetical protein
MKLLYLACLVPLASCGGDDDCCSTVNDGSVTDAAGDGRVEVARVPVTVNRDLDLLFVIDDSPSMLDKQTNLKNNFPNFINVLNGIEGGLPNVHIGVVSTDLGSKGADDASPGPGIGSGPGSCSANGKAGNLQTNGSTLLTGTFLSDTKNTDGSRTTNYVGSLANAFSAIASLGASGCGFEQPLEAAKRALNNNPANAGFLRPNAGLAILFVTDEDDCSFSHSTLLGSDTATLGPLQSFRCTRFGVTCDTAGMTPDQMNTVGVKSQCHSNEASQYLTRIGDYETFFKSLKANANNVMVTALAGPVTPFAVELRVPPGGGEPITALGHSCEYLGLNGAEVADPAARLVQLAQRFPRNSIATICQQDLSEPLVQFAQQARGLLGDACLYRELATPIDCIVNEQVGSTSTMLPACNNGTMSTNKPCWEIVADPVLCAAGSHLKLGVQRAAAPSPDAVVVARCKV